MGNIINRSLLYPCVLLLVFLVLTGCKEEIFSSLPEREANEMLAVLLKSGVDAKKIKQKSTNKSQRFSLEVDSTDMADAITMLLNSGYPREEFDSVNLIFKGDKLVTSPLEEQIRAVYSIEQGIQETLGQIDGVISSRVKIVLPNINETRAPKDEDISASVFIKYLPKARLTDIRSEIKLIIEKSVKGLSYDNVALVMLPSKTWPSLHSKNSLVSVFGIRLSKDSEGHFLRVFGLMVLLIIACIVYIALSTSKQRTSKDKNTGISSANANKQSIRRKKNIQTNTGNIQQS